MLGNWMSENNYTGFTMPSSSGTQFKVGGQQTNVTSIEFTYDATTGKAVLAEGTNISLMLYVDSAGNKYTTKPEGIDTVELPVSIVGGSIVADIDPAGQLTFAGANIAK
jgi:hypothetical protein